MRATWKKNRDGDGYIIRIVLSKNDRDVNEGDSIHVERKDGNGRTEKIKRILWAGPSTDEGRAPGDIIVLAEAVQKPRKSGKDMIAAARKGKPSKKSEPEPDADDDSGDSDDDIPF